MNRIAFAATVAAALISYSTTTAHARAKSTTFEVTFDDCTEFVGIASVDIANVEDLVPAELTILGDGSNALVVVRIVDCDAISVDGRATRPGRVTQIGVSVVGDGSADIDNYTLWYGTNHPRLRAGLVAAGMRTARVRQFDYDVVLDETGVGTLEAKVRAPTLPNHAIDADVEAPAAAPVNFVARWTDEGRFGTVDMLTTFPNLIFGVAETVLTTPPRSRLAAVLGTNRATFDILDSFNAWDTATMVVSVE